MVETKEREVIYTTDADSGPSTAIAIIFSLLIVAALGFMVYYFSNHNLNNSPSIIERDTSTTTNIPMPVPVQTPAPAAPTTINVQPAASTPAPAPASSDSSTAQ